ncbi:protein phosphatase, Mg2 Mn2 dependent [Nesidiocoris tenuis]|uniref:Protein phosphatase, Mg2 Mn2 dependent n=1 Tax=Nesidiocoris tenuis TaxID=355587 RepID=A0ABN7B415_9HEMI|nr:protein phosphatase, Mg2 Mn2 dependent [Nesidiocoris tenuis]
MSFIPLGMYHGYGVPGYLLNKPVLNKHTRFDANDTVVVTSSSMQGWRHTMEDVSVVLLKIPGDQTGTMYFSVFDGHGGSKVAKYAGAHLHKFVMKQREWDWDLKDAINRFEASFS